MKEAETRIAAKDFDGAVQSLKKALALKPDLLEAQRIIIGAYLAKDSVSEAVAVARDVQRQRPSEPIGYILEGDIQVSRKEWDAAASAFRKGLARTPSTDLAARTVAALRAGGKVADADKVVATWLKDHPNDRDFRSFVAESAMMRRDFATAAQQYKLLHDLKPDDAIARLPGDAGEFPRH